MGNTIFYEEVKKENPNITWKDILSESFKKHSMKDLEYALAAGSVYDTASPETMLKKWHKPWVWTRVFLLLSVIGFGFYGINALICVSYGPMWSTLIILTCVTPITSMVLFWELNVARDISFVKLFMCFMIGGLLSLAFTLILNEAGVQSTAISLTNTNPNGFWGAWVAPLTEEPAKLLAGLIILRVLAKHENNIFGCTGIAIGAGVGTGFTLFESFGYVMNTTVDQIVSNENTWYSFVSLINNGYDPFDYSDVLRPMFSAGLHNILGRSIPGINAHMLMCVPYIAMIALTYHETRNWKASVINKKTGVMFLASCFLHGWWDCMDAITISFCNIQTQAQYDSMAWFPDMIQEVAIMVLYLICNLYVIRLCLQQAVREGDYVSGQGMALGESTKHRWEDGRNGGGNDQGSRKTPIAKPLTVISTGRILAGSVWQCENTVLIGKMNDCMIRFPADTQGLSRVHCRLKNCGSYWTICDVGSSYGTFVNGTKLNPNTEYRLTTGSVLELGSANVQLRIQMKGV